MICKSRHRWRWYDSVLASGNLMQFSRIEDLKLQKLVFVKIRRLYYSNKDDPRVFVYRDENGPSGYGVTLNFAHKKAMLMGVLWLGLLILPVVLLCIYVRSSLIASLSAIPLLGLCVSCIVVFYRGAARDLKKFPGLKGPRDGKGDC